jgi:hypothetical protein
MLDGNSPTDMISGWWCNNHLEKYESQGKDYPIYSGK